ncbi:MAG: hypothetical protein U1F63_12345 [Chitinivorax sp.]
MNKLLATLSLALLLAAPAGYAGDVVLIGNGNVPKIDAETAVRLYTGRAIQVAGVNVTPVNLKSGVRLRGQFLADLLGMDEERYVAYWTVRRYIGKGAPPRELEGSAEVIGYVQSTPGAIGYIDSSELKPGLNVVLKR